MPQEPAEKVIANRSARHTKRAAKQSPKGSTFGRILLVLFTTVLAAVLALFLTVFTIVKGPSESAKELFVSTVLESGNLKFLATLFLSNEEVLAIVERVSMREMETDIDTGLIHTDEGAKGNFDANGVEIVELNGRTYSATLMIVQNPKNVIVGSTYPWEEYGKTLDEIVKNEGGIGGVNGGLYAADKNKGGSPYGLCISEGEIQLNAPSSWPGLYLIGLDREDILRIERIEGWSPSELEKFAEENGIRDAVAFQEDASDVNNHFVPLVINGEPRELSGKGSGANPRTAIGQRADGAILLLVTDGRGSSGHLGATAADLISIMMEYGAVNAANLDGGSSSCMFYDDVWYRTSVTLYYANKSWNLPTAFVVKKGGE